MLSFKPKESTGNEYKVKTAWPLLIGFFAIAGYVLFYQGFLAEQEQVVPKVEIKSSRADESDIELSRKNIEFSEEENEQVELLTKFILDWQSGGGDSRTDKDRLEGDFQTGNYITEALKKLSVNTNSEEHRGKLLFGLFQYFYSERKWAICYQLLNLLTPSQVSQFELSFEEALVLSKLKMTDEAVKAYLALLANTPAHQAATINLGLIYLRQGEFEKAESVFENSLSFASGAYKSKIYAGLGDAQVGLGKYQLGLSNYQKSIEHRPTYGPTWEKVARTEARLNTPASQVIASYHKAISLAPKRLSLNVEFSKFLISQLENKKVIQALRKKLSRSKSSVEQRLLLIYAYAMNGRLANAKKQLKFLTKYNSKSRNLLLAKGFEALVNKKPKESMDFFKQTLKKGRDNGLAYMMIGLLYESLNKPKNALIYFNKIVPSHFLFNQAEFHKGLIAIQQKEHDKATLIYRELFKRVQENSEIAFYVASNAFDRRNLDVASAAIDYSLRLKPDSKKYLLLNAKINWRQGLRSKAIDDLKTLLETRPSYRPAWYRLADYQFIEGRLNKSLASFRRLYDLDADYSNVELRIAKLMHLVSPKLIDETQLIVSYLQRRSSDIKAREYLAKLLCESNKLTECRVQVDIIKRFDESSQIASMLEKNYF